MIDQNKFDSMLLEISGKETVVKCEPFKFRLSVSGKFDNTDDKKFKDINNQIKSFAYKKGETKPSLVELTPELITRLNTDKLQKELSLIIFPFLAGLHDSFPQADWNKSELNVNFVVRSSIYWDADYELVSDEFVCISLLKIDGITTIFYIDGNEVKQIKQVTGNCIS